LPEITKDYFNTLLEIDEFITNTTICSLKFAKDSSALLQNLYNHHLSAEQQQWLKERTKMGNLVAMIREEWTREAMLEGKAEGIAIGEAKGEAKGKMSVALAAFRRAKSANDFPGVIETLKELDIAEDIIKNALNQVRAEFKKKSRN
jgi:flagellar biosynthesis/type III secretory pathway protein FliH